MPHVNWSVSISDVLIIVGAIAAAARWIVVSIHQAMHRLDLHEEALVTAGWLRRNKWGELEIPHRAGAVR